MAKATKINASAQARIDAYLVEAEFFATAPASKLVKELTSLGYTAKELSTPELVKAAAKVERNARLHRARAVRSTAKRSSKRAA